MFCEKCGSQLPDDSKFCLNCGAQNEVAQPVQDVEQEAAASVDAAPAVSEAAADTKPTIEQAQAPEQPKPQPEPVKEEATSPVQAAPRPAPQMAPQTAYAPPTGQPYQQPIPPTQQYTVEPKPEKITPLPTWKFIGMFILTGIPIVGLIMVLVWSFGGSFNRNTKSFGRAILILGIIGLVLSIISVIMYWSVLEGIVNAFGSSGLQFNY